MKIVRLYQLNRLHGITLGLVFLSAMIIPGCGPVREPVDASDAPVEVSHVRGHVYLVEDHNYWKTNAPFYVSDEGAVFTCAGWSEKSARRILWKAATLTLAEFTAVVPADHQLPCTGGLAEFHRQDVPLYTTAKTRGLLHSEWQRMTDQMSSFGSWRTPNRIDPDHIIHEQIEFLNGAMVVRQFDAGEQQDLLAFYFPEEKILYLGNALAEPPHFARFDPLKLKAALHEIQKLPFQTVISGHGKPLRDRAFFETQLNALP